MSRLARRAANVGCLLLGAACARRAPDIPEARPSPPATAPSSAERLAEPAEETEQPARRLRMPPSRAGVLDLLARFQSSIASGQPPLDELLTKSAGLTAPALETRRGVPSRSTIAQALGSNFVDPKLAYDPFEVVVRAREAGAVARIPLDSVAGSTPRRIVLSLELGYSAGELLIEDITLTRSQ